MGKVGARRKWPTQTGDFRREISDLTLVRRGGQSPDPGKVELDLEYILWDNKNREMAEKFVQNSPLAS